MANLSEEDMKNALKKALKEWLDEKYAEVGRWSIHAIVVAALGALTFWILHQNGWTKAVVATH